MLPLALRGLAQRKLRSSLTALAILLGVAMVAGTFVLTDQIAGAFEDIQRDANAGIDVVVRAEETFGGQGRERTLPVSLLERVRAVEGVEAAEAELEMSGSLVVDGEVVETRGPPTEIRSAQPAPFDATRVVDGRRVQAPGELAVLSETATRAEIAIGDEIGVVGRRGVEPVTVVGTFDLGASNTSVGGLSAVIADRSDIETWFAERGRATAIEVTAATGVDADALSGRVRSALDGDVTVRTGEQSAQEAAQEINDQIAGFLVPALLSFAGAAVLVGAFIIFNTFSITVAQRAREFALLRCLGASRAQLMRTVALEALVIGTIASVAGILVGLGIALGISALFDAVGVAIPRGGLVLAPRTIAVSLAVGLGITLLAALAPALRATRVAPVAALSEAPVVLTRRRRRWSTLLALAVLALGVAAVIAGAFGSGPAAARLSTMGAGAVLVFIGVALNARHLVRPLAGAIGWPLQRIFHTPGRLARENAMRNPSRTAITSAALMVGLALVVFVSVFAASLRGSISENIDELIRGDLFVYPENFQPLPRTVATAIGAVPGVDVATGIAFEQLEVDGRPSNPIYDIALGVDPAALSRVYRFEWVEGSDALLARLSGNRALVEEQFARARGVGVGDTYAVRTTSGGRARFEVIGIYRDPAVLQGTMVDARSLARISEARDPTFVLADIAAGADAEGVQAGVEEALDDFPLATVQSRAEYQKTIADRLGQLVSLIYALLGVSLVISLFGIANNLYLSIHERIREFGLLRAVGASRSQLRRIVRYESVITAVIGGLLGIGVGVVFASLIIGSLGEFGLSLSVPIPSLLGFAALAVLAGVLGAVLPARRGARVDVLAALHHD